MPYIESDYESVKDFFDSSAAVPSSISGIWSLKDLNNMSILMSFNNATFLNSTATIKLHKPGNWLFKKNNIFVSTISKFIKYSYQFNFDSDFKNANIYIKLGCIPLYFPKWLTNWTVKVDTENNRIIRETSFLWFKHTYFLTKVENEYDIFNLGLDKLYY